MRLLHTFHVINAVQLSKIWSVIETRLPDGFAVNWEDEMLGGELDLPDLHDDDGR